MTALPTGAAAVAAAVTLVVTLVLLPANGVLPFCGGVDPLDWPCDRDFFSRFPSAPELARASFFSRLPDDSPRLWLLFCAEPSESLSVLPRPPLRGLPPLLLALVSR